MARKKNERIIRQAYGDERKSQRYSEKFNDNQRASTSTRSKSYGKNNDGESYFDKNDKHFVNFNNQLTCMGLMIRNINGDGNCLFRALNDQLEGHSRNHMQYRTEIVRYMIENRKDFEAFIEDDVPFEKYMTNLGKDGTFAGQDVLVAFARMRKINIVIHQLNSPLWHINGGCANSVPEVHLSYHNGEHYSSVRKLDDTNETAANIKLNIQPSKAQSHQESIQVEKNWNSSNDGYLDNDFDINQRMQQIMIISGCSDVVLAQQTLIDCNYNMEEAADCLTSLMLISHQDDHQDETSPFLPEDLVPVSSSSIVPEPCPLSIEPASVQPQSGAKQKKPIQNVKKHLSNKARKDLRRRERVEKQMTKVENDRTIDEAVVVASLGSLNL